MYMTICRSIDIRCSQKSNKAFQKPQETFESSEQISLATP